MTDEEFAVNMNFEEKKPDRTARPSEIADRVVIRRVENEKFARCMEQINARFEGFGKITKNDVANFLFRKYPDELSDEDLIQLGAGFYDEVHWLNWALERIKQSKRDGDCLTLNELMQKRDAIAPAQKVRKKRTIIKCTAEQREANFKNELE